MNALSELREMVSALQEAKKERDRMESCLKEARIDHIIRRPEE